MHYKTPDCPLGCYPCAIERCVWSILNDISAETNGERYVLKLAAEIMRRKLIDEKPIDDANERSIRGLK